MRRARKRLLLWITILAGLLFVLNIRSLGVTTDIWFTDKAGIKTRVKAGIKAWVTSGIKTSVKAEVEDDAKGRQLIFSELGKPWATYVDKVDDEHLHPNGQNQTSDHWPVFSKPYFQHDIPRSPYRPTFVAKWNFDTAAFLEKPHVKGKPPKLLTWMVKTRPMMPLPEAVRLRMCPEMPCRLTTNRRRARESAALLFTAEQIEISQPPRRAHPDQVFVLHNHEPQTEYWARHSKFRTKPWNNVFNWTWFCRMDSDIPALHAYVVRRHTPVTKNFTSLVAGKTHQAAWLVSHCPVGSRRMDYVMELKKYISVDVYGDCGTLECPRSSDDACTDMFNRKYRYYLSFESEFCTDYISPKFFKFFNQDIIPVVRGSNEYKFHAPEGTYINTADFKSPKDLAAYLKHLDSHPDEYEAILRRKAQWLALFEDWPIRFRNGTVEWMQYHFEAFGYCEMCRRLWELDSYRKSVADMGRWIDQGNCREPDDMGWEHKNSTKAPMEAQDVGPFGPMDLRPPGN